MSQPPAQHDADTPAADDWSVDDDAELVPPRFWWLRRVGLTAAALFLVSAGLHLWACLHAQSRLDALIERHRAAGEPVYPQDFAPADPPPDKENAATLYLAAQQHFDANRSYFGWSVARAILSDGFTAESMAAFEPVLAGNAKAIQLVRQARDRRRVDWGVRHKTPMANTTFSGSGRLFGRFLATAAMYRIGSGDSREAVELLRDLVLYAHRTMGEDGGSAYLYLNELSALNSAASVIELALPDLAMSEAHGGEVSTASIADSRQAEALIEALLDDRPQIDGYRAMLMWERAALVDVVHAMSAGNLQFPGLANPGRSPQSLLIGLAMRPLWVADAAEEFQQITALIQAGKSPSYCTSYPLLITVIPTARAMRNTLMPLGWWDPRRSRLVHWEYRTRAVRRMAGVALAIRWYESDHGRRPDRLADLVPDYLDAVPVDPFACDGGLIGYLPHADPPRLYSVGIDGVDNGGAYRLGPGSGIDIDALDYPFFLNGDPP